MEVILKHEFRKWNSIEHYDYNTLNFEKKLDKSKSKDDDIFSLYENEHIPREGKWKYKKSDKTEEFFTKNYGNPACAVWIQLLTIVLEKDENKVSLKVFTNTKHRDVSKPYFKKTTSLRYLTYNLKTHDLYHGNMSNYHKKRKYSSSVKKNTFSVRPINTFSNVLSNTFNEWSETLMLNGLEKYPLIRSYIYTFLKLIGLENEVIYRTDEFHYNGDKLLFRKNMIKKGIKCPDNYDVFMEQFPLPNKKDIKKYGNKLIDIVMGRHGITGGKFKKILHTIKNFNPDFLKYGINLFGVDAIKSLSDDYLIKFIESNNYHNGFLYDGTVESIVGIKDSKRVFTIFKLVIEGEINFQTFRDHIRFYHSLNRFEPVKWLSHDKETFVNEHLDFTEKIEQYSKGLYFREYSNDFENIFQNEIICNGIKYSPILLKDSKSYIEESSIQSNCVKTYISRASSFIISLRNESERATIEYSLKRNPITEELRAYRVQSLGRFNSSLSDEWTKPLEILDNIIDEFFKNHKFILPKIKIIFKNGAKSETIAIFKESRAHPCWENEYFDAVKTYYNGVINFETDF